jgi:hypothetical protein
MWLYDLGQIVELRQDLASLCIQQGMHVFFNILIATVSFNTKSEHLHGQFFFWKKKEVNHIEEIIFFFIVVLGRGTL